MKNYSDTFRHQKKIDEDERCRVRDDAVALHDLSHDKIELLSFSRDAGKE
jgi:hypothetical protein